MPLIVFWFGPAFVAACIMDRVVGGALGNAADEVMKKDVDRRFDPRDPRFKSERW